MWAGAWPKFIPATLQSASFFIHLAKMDIHEDRWPRHLHLVHLVLPASISCVDLDRSIVAARQPRSQPLDAGAISAWRTTAPSSSATPSCSFE